MLTESHKACVGSKKAIPICNMAERKRWLWSLIITLFFFLCSSMFVFLYPFIDLLAPVTWQQRGLHWNREGTAGERQITPACFNTFPLEYGKFNQISLFSSSRLCSQLKYLQLSQTHCFIFSLNAPWETGVFSSCSQCLFWRFPHTVLLHLPSRSLEITWTRLQLKQQTRLPVSCLYFVTSSLASILYGGWFLNSVFLPVCQQPFILPGLVSAVGYSFLFPKWSEMNPWDQAFSITEWTYAAEQLHTFLAKVAPVRSREAALSMTHWQTLACQVGEGLSETLAAHPLNPALPSVSTLLFSCRFSCIFQFLLESFQFKFIKRHLKPRIQNIYALAALQGPCFLTAVLKWHMLWWEVQNAPLAV